MVEAGCGDRLCAFAFSILALRQHSEQLEYHQPTPHQLLGHCFLYHIVSCWMVELCYPVGCLGIQLEFHQIALKFLVLTLMMLLAR